MTQHLKGMKIAILLTDGFEQVEMVKPREALDKEGAQTFLISPKTDTVRGWHHDVPADTFPVDVPLSQAKPEDYDALLLPGGVFNPDALRLNAMAIDFIKAIAESGKPIAAICHGPWTLINAGAVKGRTMTSWPSLQTDLTNAGAIWVDKEVVRDGKLVTSRKPADIPAFNAAMIQLFSNDTYKGNDHHGFLGLVLVAASAGVIATYEMQLPSQLQTMIALTCLVVILSILGYTLFRKKLRCGWCLLYFVWALIALSAACYELLPLFKPE